jgi:transcription termination factor Rho
MNKDKPQSTTKPKQPTKGTSKGKSSTEAKDNKVIDIKAAKPEAIKWIYYDGVYSSNDDRFTIMRASANYHSGEWDMYDSKTKLTYFEPTLRDCKYIAETYLSKQ